MVSGDYIEKQEKNKKGKLVNYKVIRSTTGVEYGVGNQLGEGGFGVVYRAKRMSDGKKCVFKEFPPDPLKRKIHSQIKRNITNLAVNPILDFDNTRLESFVGPMDRDSIIQLPASRGFGYIMEQVDTERFVKVFSMWKPGVYPDAEKLSKICYNIAHLFGRIHLRGYSYRDISRENVYMDPKTGDIRVIDCDNISANEESPVKGTPGFIAPEVYVTSTPDTYTDYFSMAVILYYILIGGDPMYGKKVEDYCIKNESSIATDEKTQKRFYGTEALFVFDPKDRSNTIHNLVDSQRPKMYKLQEENWEWQPQMIKDAFIKTFSEGLKSDKRHLRTTDAEWKEIFTELKKNSLVECKNVKCKKKNFGSIQASRGCFYCGSTLPKLPIPKPVVGHKPPIGTRPVQRPAQQPIQRPAQQPIQRPAQQPVQQPAQQLSSVTFFIRRDIGNNLTMTVKKKTGLPGNTIYPGLSDGWMRILYNQNKNMLAAKNMSQYVWTIRVEGNKSQCAPGEMVILRKGMVIIVRPRQLQFTVTDIL